MIGIATIRELQKAEDINIIYAIVRASSENIKILTKCDKVRVVYCSLEEYEKLPLMIDERCDLLYHFAWQGAGRCDIRNGSALMQAENIVFSIKLMAVANQLGVKTFVGAGSQAEYGPKNQERIAPEDTVSPVEMYGIAKYATGRLLIEQAAIYGMSCFWVRIFSVYGCYNAKDTLISSAVSNFCKNERMSFTGGEQNWDYLNSKDAGRALYLIGKLTGRKVYCLGYGKTRKLKDYINVIHEMSNATCEIGLGEIEYSKNAVMNLCADIEALKNDTGWSPEVSFEIGIAELIEATINSKESGGEKNEERY